MSEQEQTREPRAMAEAIEQRRYGRISIQDEVLREMTDPLHREVFGQLSVVRAELEWTNDRVEYVCASPLFEPVLPGAQSPQYDVQVERREQGDLVAYTVRFAKVNY